MADDMVPAAAPAAGDAAADSCLLRALVDRVRLPAERVAALRDLQDKLQSALESRFPALSVHMYGSVATGFALAGSDVDFSLSMDASGWLDGDEHLRGGDSRRLAASRLLQDVLAAIRAADGLPLSAVGTVLSARVPLLTAVHNDTDTTVDLSVNNNDAVRNSRLLARYAALDDRVVTVVLAVKAWARGLDLLMPREGSLNSYTLTLMVIFALQQHSRLQLACLTERDGAEEEKGEEEGEAGKEGEGEAGGQAVAAIDLLRWFWRFYARDFPIDKCVVCIHQRKRLYKSKMKWKDKRQPYRICVVDAVQQDLDVAQRSDYDWHLRTLRACEHADGIVEEGEDVAALTSLMAAHAEHKEEAI
eukprot:PLAT11365.4.p1 GENE.PLAT11365.4~~PLAT11365.4.p1  ORF type:complete len:368 (+),score=162.89 PLAT11365.4:22-1104(+)